jgi:hypothetical protein
MMSRITVIALLLAALYVPQAEALETEELLALVAMPLVVNAVADIAGVPERQLFEFVSLLNLADVPPPMFIETVRYVPMALVVDDDGAFVEYVRLQTQQGVRGTELVRLIEDRYHDSYDLPQANLVVTAPRSIARGDAYVPVIVRDRVTEWRNHPHGGPPGQVKKQLGLQTGAEVVHGTTPGRTRSVERDRRDVVSTVLDPLAKSNRQNVPPGQARKTDDAPRRSPAVSNQGNQGNQGKGNPAAGGQNPGNQGKGNQGKGNQGKGNQGKGKGPGR